MKLPARDDRNRPQDADDLVALQTSCDAAETARAREAVELIAKRGYDRGRNLMRSFEAWRAGKPPPRS